MPIKELIDRKNWTIIRRWIVLILHPLQTAPIHSEVFQHPSSRPTLCTLEHHLTT